MRENYTSKDDKELWAELRNGNINAVEALYRKYYALLLNYGNKCTPNNEIVRDCIQELFVKLCNSKHISYTESPRAYLLKSIRNLISDKQTSLTHKSEYLSFNDDVILSVFSDDGIDKNYDESDEDIRMKQSLIKALSQLSNTQKHILYLRYIKNLSHKEVADVIGMSEQSSMNLLSRTLKKLREILSDHSISMISFFIWINSNID